MDNVRANEDWNVDLNSGSDYPSSGRLIYSSPCKGYVISFPGEQVYGRLVRDRTIAITS